MKWVQPWFLRMMACHSASRGPPARDQVAGRRRPVRLFEPEPCGEQAAGHHPSALQDQFGLGAQEERADLQHDQIEGAKPLPDLEDYDYPGRFVERARGKHLSQRHLERHRADYRLAEGRGDQPKLLSGHFLELSDHPRQDYNNLWILHEVIHQGKQPQVLEESITDFSDHHGTTPSPLRGEG